MRRYILLGFSVCFAFANPLLIFAQLRNEGAQPPYRIESGQPPYRIGIIDYDGSTEPRKKDISAAFASLTPPQKVIFASGTAEEVLDWVSEGLVDIAILTPGAFSATIALLTDEDKQDAYRIAKKTGKPRPWDCQYLITRSLLASTNPFAPPRRKKNGGFVYEPMCLINKK